jgi:putative CocE/NonD family hydrolase
MNALNNEPKTDLDYVVEKNIKVQMRDGVKLALDFYKPLNNGRLKKGRYPTLLVRTPYNKDNYQKDGVWFSSKGYAVCIQDIRGRFQSEGSFVKYGFSDVDGYDTIEWAAKQNWSTGKVGTFGGSFLAHVQVAAATQKPPHLRAMVLSQGGYANAYLSGIRHGGAFEMTSLCWLLTRSLNSNDASQNPVIKKALEMIPLEGYLDPRRGQVKQGITPFNFFPDYEKIFFDTLLHSEYDEYWKTPWHSAELFYDNFADVPVLIETGWYDHYTLNDCMLYTGLSRGKRGPIKLIIGPWTHGGTMLTYSGEVEFGPTAPLDAGIAQSHNDLILGWFDHWLKAIDK